MNQNLACEVGEKYNLNKNAMKLYTGLDFMKKNVVSLTLLLEENREEGATTVSRNEKTALGSQPKRQVNMRGEMKHCSFFFNVNAFSCAPVCSSCLRFARQHPLEFRLSIPNN